MRRILIPVRQAASLFLAATAFVQNACDTKHNASIDAPDVHVSKPATVACAIDTEQSARCEGGWLYSRKNPTIGGDSSSDSVCRSYNLASPTTQSAAFFASEAPAETLGSASLCGAIVGYSGFYRNLYSGVWTDNTSQWIASQGFYGFVDADCFPCEGALLDMPYECRGQCAAVHNYGYPQCLCDRDINPDGDQSAINSELRQTICSCSDGTTHSVYGVSWGSAHDAKMWGPEFKNAENTAHHATYVYEHAKASIDEFLPWHLESFPESLLKTDRASLPGLLPKTDLVGASFVITGWDALSTGDNPFTNCVNGLSLDYTYYTARPSPSGAPVEGYAACGERGSDQRLGAAQPAWATTGNRIVVLGPAGKTKSDMATRDEGFDTASAVCATCDDVGSSNGETSMVVARAKCLWNRLEQLNNGAVDVGYQTSTSKQAIVRRLLTIFESHTDEESQPRDSLFAATEKEPSAWIALYRRHSSATPSCGIEASDSQMGAEAIASCVQASERWRATLCNRLARGSIHPEAQYEALTECLALRIGGTDSRCRALETDYAAIADQLIEKSRPTFISAVGDAYSGLNGEEGTDPEDAEQQIRDVLEARIKQLAALLENGFDESAERAAWQSASVLLGDLVEGATGCDLRAEDISQCEFPGQSPTGAEVEKHLSVRRMLAIRDAIVTLFGKTRAGEGPCLSQTLEPNLLLAVAGGLFSVLVDSLETRNEFHDFICSVYGCQEQDDTTRLAAVWQAIGKVADLDALSAAVAEHGALLANGPVDWRAAFDAVVQCGEPMETALCAAGYCGDETDLGDEPIATLESINDPTVRDITVAVSLARSRSTSFESGGLLTDSGRPTVMASLLGTVYSNLLATVATLRSQLDTDLRAYDDSVEKLYSDEEKLAAQEGQEALAEANILRIEQEIKDATEEIGVHRRRMRDEDLFDSLVDEYTSVKESIDSDTYLPIVDASDDDGDRFGDIDELRGSQATAYDPHNKMLSAVSFRTLDLNAGEILVVSVDPSDKWSPSCAMQRHALLDAPLLTGPAGYASQVTDSSYEATQTDEYNGSTTIRSSTDQGCSSGSFAVQLFGFGGGFNGSSCDVEQQTRESGFRVTESSGSETRSTTSFGVGVFLPDTPVPWAPAGALLAVEVDQSNKYPEFDEIVDVHLVRAPTTTIVPSADATLYFVINDFRIGSSCVYSSGEDGKGEEALKVELSGYADAATAAVPILHSMSTALDYLRTERAKIEKEKGFLVDGDIETMRAEVNKRLYQNPSGYGGTLPQVDALFAAFRERELTSISRVARVQQLERELRALWLKWKASSIDYTSIRDVRDYAERLHAFRRERSGTAGQDLLESTRTLAEYARVAVAPVARLFDTGERGTSLTMQVDELSAILSRDFLSYGPETPLEAFARSVYDWTSAYEKIKNWKSLSDPVSASMTVAVTFRNPYWKNLPTYENKGLAPFVGMAAFGQEYGAWGVWEGGDSDGDWCIPELEGSSDDSGTGQCVARYVIGIDADYQPCVLSSGETTPECRLVERPGAKVVAGATVLCDVADPDERRCDALWLEKVTPVDATRAMAFWSDVKNVKADVPTSQWVDVPIDVGDIYAADSEVKEKQLGCAQILPVLKHLTFVFRKPGADVDDTAIVYNPPRLSSRADAVQATATKDALEYYEYETVDGALSRDVSFTFADIEVDARHQMLLDRIETESRGYSALSSHRVNFTADPAGAEINDEVSEMVVYMEVEARNIAEGPLWLSECAPAASGEE